MLTTRRTLLYCLLPLLISFTIYAVFRSPDTIVNQVLLAIWPTKPPMLHLPQAAWVVYNLPGALWLFAFLWIGTLSASRRLTLLPLGLALGIEAVQLLHFTDGTFDALDVLFYLLALGVFAALGGLARQAPPVAPAATAEPIMQHLSKRYKLAMAVFVAMVLLSDVWVK